jgi:hypothetical protein
MRGLWAAAGVAGWVALGCAGPAQPPEAQPPAPAARPELAAFFARPPFDDVGLPGAPWDQGEPTGSSSKREAGVEILYGGLPGTPEEAIAAFKAASLARGWAEDDRKPRTDRASLRRTGARLSISSIDGGIRLRREVKRLVEESWPVDPFCPDGTRLDPKNQDTQVRTCYAVGTEMEERGPYEMRSDDITERGQHEAGLRVGRWVAVVKDVDEVVYDVVTEYGPERTTRTWHRKDDGKLVLTEALQGQDAYLVRHGPQVWEGGPTIRFDKGLPEPSFAQSAARSDNALQTELEDELEILDVDPEAGLVAFRHLDLPNPDAGLHPCAYPGMEDPLAAVDLGVLEVATGQVTRWTVYKAASKPEECTPEAESKRALASAKARMAELGLDTTRKPQPIAPQVERSEQVARYHVQLSGREVSLAVEKLYHGPVSEPGRYALLPDLESNTIAGFWGGVARPPLFESYHPMNNLRPSLALFGAWEEGGHAVVGWKNDAIPCCTVWGFVPVR